MTLIAKNLTPRQTEIIKLVRDGYSRKEIAARLCISYETVKTHQADIFNRLQCHNATQAVTTAARCGIINITGGFIKYE